MSPLAAIVLAGATLGVAAPLILPRLGRLDHTPQVAAYLWLLAALGAVSAAVLAGLLLLVGSSHLVVDLAALLATCSMALRAALDTPASTAGPLLGLALLTTVTGGLLVGGLVAAARAWRAARSHRELLTLAGRAQPGLPGVTVVDHPAPLAYCLPGRVGRPRPIVLTTAILQQLDPGQLAALLTHEHAHQTHRHHALLLVAAALRIGLPWLPAARAAHSAVARLVELAADDAAVHHHDRADIAAALATLATAPAPTLGLGAAGPNTLERIRRLTVPPATPSHGALLLASLVVVAPLLGQLLALTAPLLRVAGTPTCPLT
jgi:Zn-dependent protease with chaperone function